MRFRRKRVIPPAPQGRTCPERNAMNRQSPPPSVAPKDGRKTFGLLYALLGTMVDSSNFVTAKYGLRGLRHRGPDQGRGAWDS